MSVAIFTTLFQASFVFEDANIGDTFGISIAGAGDTNGNTFLDVLIGSKANGTGIITLHSAYD